MEAQRKLMIGFDLCEDFSQISCYSFKTFEPVSVSMNNEEEDCLIPTVLCLKGDSELWCYGEEAKAAAADGEGILIDALLTKLKNKQEIEINNEKYTAVSLVEKFIKKCLTYIKTYFPTEPVTKIVITIPDMDPVIVDGIYEALANLGLDNDRAAVLSHANCYLYYALSQDKSLWMNDVGLFDFGEEGLNFYQININRRVRPMIAGITRKNFTDTLNYELAKKNGSNASYALENIANTVLYKQIISTLYFTGKGFEGGWADEVIKSLCIGRRVYMGQNLYTKGACYAAKELSGDKKLGDFILLDDDMITSNIFIQVYKDAKPQELLLTKAAIPWYKVNQSIEIIPDNQKEIEVIIKSMITRGVIRYNFVLNNLPDRSNKMTRLHINLSCLSTSKAVLKVTDLGFGEIYPPVNLNIKMEFDI